MEGAGEVVVVTVGCEVGGVVLVVPVGCDAGAVVVVVTVGWAVDAGALLSSTPNPLKISCQVAGVAIPLTARL